MINTIEFDKDTLVVSPGQVLDNNNAHEVMHVIDDVLKTNKSLILFDMSRVEFLSSAGVGSLISSLSTLRSNGRAMSLYSLSDKIMHVFQVLDLCDYMPIEADRDLAMARCKSLLQNEKSPQ